MHQRKTSTTPSIDQMRLTGTRSLLSQDGTTTILCSNVSSTNTGLGMTQLHMFNRADSTKYNSASTDSENDLIESNHFVSSPFDDQSAIIKTRGEQSAISKQTGDQSAVAFSTAIKSDYQSEIKKTADNQLAITKRVTDIQPTACKTAAKQSALMTPSAVNRNISLRSVRSEHKAAMTLGIIIGGFLCCWLPFFSWYAAVTLCDTCPTPPTLVSALFWIGYANSAVNPAVYALHNRDFRTAFLRQLGCSKLLQRRRDKLRAALYGP